MSSVRVSRPPTEADGIRSRSARSHHRHGRPFNCPTIDKRAAPALAHGTNYRLIVGSITVVELPHRVADLVRAESRAEHKSRAVRQVSGREAAVSESFISRGLQEPRWSRARVREGVLGVLHLGCAVDSVFGTIKLLDRRERIATIANARKQFVDTHPERRDTAHSSYHYSCHGNSLPGVRRNGERQLATALEWSRTR
jgi:hypothetical protein